MTRIILGSGMLALASMPAIASVPTALARVTLEPLPLHYLCINPKLASNAYVCILPPRHARTR
jgi:hypothetical protein